MLNIDARMVGAVCCGGYWAESVSAKYDGLAKITHSQGINSSCNPGWYNLTVVPLGTNFSELLNIQKRDSPFAGPSFTNSWPSPFPHFPHRTWNNTLYNWMKILCISIELALNRLNKSFTSLLRVAYPHLVTYSCLFWIYKKEIVCWLV